MTKKQTHQFGIFAEKLAILFLFLKGYKILAWRYKTRLGEVDIIAKKSKIIIAVEVKARVKETPIDEVLRDGQIRRIQNAAELFIAKNKRYHNHNLRFDFIEVRGIFKIRHYKNFF